MRAVTAGLLSACCDGGPADWFIATITEVSCTLNKNKSQGKAGKPGKMLWCPTNFMCRLSKARTICQLHLPEANGLSAGLAKYKSPSPVECTPIGVGAVVTAKG